MDSFIRSYDRVLDPKTLQEVLKIAASTDDKQRTRGGAKFNIRNNGTVRDRQILLEPFWPQLAMEVSHAVFDRLLKPYITEFSLIKDLEADWMNGCCLLQKTAPSEGYHRFHIENSGYINQTRNMAWMIYLNDVQEGGETEFPYQSMRFQPKENMGMIWPGGVTHFHRGLPPYSNEKLILTGWLATSNDIMTYHVSTPNPLDPHDPNSKGN